jgi:HD-GYP domain-containing protein (c-di-GMP phosphodiesterase class II)
MSVGTAAVYPDRLVGDKTPIWAQVVAMADVYVALINDRIYRKAFSRDTAFKMIMDGECGNINPKILRSLKVNCRVFTITWITGWMRIFCRQGA